MPDLAKILHEAKIHIQNECPEKAEPLLVQLVGTQYASQARLLQAELSHKSPPSPSRKAQAMLNTWATIDSIEHGGFVDDFLVKLFDLDLREEVAVISLRREVIDQLCLWIDAIEDEEWLGDIVEPVQKHPDFEHDKNFDEALEKWWFDKFTAQYNEIKITVDEALKKWAVEEAKQSLSPLLKRSTLPSSLQNKVLVLENNIVQVKADKQGLESLLGEFQQNIDDWRIVQKLTLLSNDLQYFKVESPYALPKDWQNRIENTLKDLSVQIETFIKSQAQACHDFLSVRELFNNFNNINNCDLKNIEISWFEGVQTSYQETNDNAIKFAAYVTDLEKIRQSILAEAVSLPLGLAKWLQNRANALSILINQWQQMIKGVAEPIDVQSIVSIPKAFLKDIGTYKKLWQELQTIAETIDPKNTPTDDDFKTAEQSLRQSKYKQHEFAQQLLSEVETNRQRYNFDKVLVEWDIDAFLKQCQNRTATPMIEAYLELANYKDSLYELLELSRVKSDKVAEWWNKWYGIIANLPELPAKFSEQLERIALKRRRIWFEQLDDILDKKPKAVICHEKAKMLKEWQHLSFHFVRYYQDFSRLAWYQAAMETMAVQDWRAAEKAIKSFKNAGGEKTQQERLKLLLAIRQASAESLDDLIKLLNQKWALIRLYLADELGKLLYKAIVYVWDKDEDRGRLSTLIELANSIDEEKRPRFLNLCLQWLAIEALLISQQITSNSLLLTFTKLVFVKQGTGIRYMLRKPLVRLLNWWKSDNQLLWTWFYNTSQSIKPPLILEAVNPLTQLSEQTEQKIIAIRKHLADLSEISESDLLDAKTELKFEQDIWQHLIDYTNLLPFQPAQQPIALNSLNQLNQWLEKLKQVIHNLVFLEDADLRKVTNQNSLYSTQLIIKDECRELQVHNAWLKRIYALEPLTRLTFILNQFDKNTRGFGSDNFGDLDYRDWLVTMKSYLLELIEKFEQANMVERGFWRAVSKDSWNLVCDKNGGGVLVPVPHEPDLLALYDLCPILDQEEQQFRIALIKSYDQAFLTYVPSGAQIDVNNYHAFFESLPKKAPRILRCYYLFKREAAKEPMATLLKQAKGESILPQWVNDFLEEGFF